MSKLLSEIGEMLGTSTVNEEDLEPVEEEVEDPQEEHEDGVSDTEEEVPGEEEEEIQESEEDSLDEFGLDTGTEEGDLEQDDASASTDSSPSESSETIALRAEVKSLREMLQSVTTQLLQQQTLPVASQTQSQTLPEPSSVVDTNFLDGEDFDDVLTNPEAFNRLLIKVANLAQKSVVPVVTEQVLTTTQRQSAQQKAVEKFYRDNPDLSGVRQTVSMVSQNLGAQNPNLTLEQLLEQTATMTRTMLQMPLKPQTNKTSTSSKVIRRVASPAKATTTASRKQKPTTKKKTSLQTDIEAMLDAV